MRPDNYGTARAVIYPKDVMLILGKSERNARKFMDALKKSLNKERHQFLTIHEFSQHTGIPVNEVLRYLR